MVKNINNSQYELVIVGAGVVGMGAAIAAQKQGVKKILIVALKGFKRK